MTIQDQIKQTVEQNDVVLFMKGTPDFPQCGFSGRAVQVLKACGAHFASVDVLADPQIREGVKQYSNWPTVPQLYIGGEFVGGSDIMMELYQNGELQKKLGEAAA
ncbi:MAG: Grx4 family monothiol glutaredoxin [Gammaproteobacteria bacterium]|nr:Grx4 family monothiol glutaredoxin [Gammaproteobacteria bacterium]